MEDISLPSPPSLHPRHTINNSNSARRPGLPWPVSRKPVVHHQLQASSTSGTPSSDPPLFSSDDFQSSALENYITGRGGADHNPDNDYNNYSNNSNNNDNNNSTTAIDCETARKRQYRGTWWGQTVRAKRQRRTHFKEKRNMDSGVWMCSDDSTNSSCLSLSSDNSPPFVVEDKNDGMEQGNSKDEYGTHHGSQFCHEHPLGHLNTDVFVQPTADALGVSAGESESHRRARAAVALCLEEGNDNIDLSYVDGILHNMYT